MDCPVCGCSQISCIRPGSSECNERLGQRKRYIGLTFVYYTSCRCEHGSLLMQIKRLTFICRIGHIFYFYSVAGGETTDSVSSLWSKSSAAPRSWGQRGQKERLSLVAISWGQGRWDSCFQHVVSTMFLNDYELLPVQTDEFKLNQ